LNSIRPITPTDQLNISFASDLDKLSLISDNDSGISSSSRPSSLLLPPVLPEILSLSTISNHQKTYSTFLQCPLCLKMIYMDISGVKSLSKNRLLSDIINRYYKEKSSKQQIPICQLCHPSKEQLITSICEQCQIGYCDQCREQYHPMRGPYLKHIFIDPIEQLSNHKEKVFCHDHLDHLADSYCLHCRLECCQQCSKHIHHEIISIHQAAKIFKVNSIYHISCCLSCSSVVNQAKRKKNVMCRKSKCSDACVNLIRLIVFAFRKSQKHILIKSVHCPINLMYILANFIQDKVWC
jgi:tripartite motif-containing protein 9/67